MHPFEFYSKKMNKFSTCFSIFAHIKNHTLRLIRHLTSDFEQSNYLKWTSCLLVLDIFLLKHGDEKKPVKMKGNGAKLYTYLKKRFVSATSAYILLLNYQNYN